MNVKIAEIPRESDLLLRCQFRLIPKKQDVVVRQSMVEVLNLRVRNGLRHIHAADDAANHGGRGLYIDRLINALSAGVREVLSAPGDPLLMFFSAIFLVVLLAGLAPGYTAATKHSSGFLRKDIGCPRYRQVRPPYRAAERLAIGVHDPSFSLYTGPPCVLETTGQTSFSRTGPRTEPLFGGHQVHRRHHNSCSNSRRLRSTPRPDSQSSPPTLPACLLSEQGRSELLQIVRLHS